MFMGIEIRETADMFYPGVITYYDISPRYYSLTAGNPGDYVAPEVVRYLLDAEETLNEEIGSR